MTSSVSNIRNITMIGLMAALITICSWISIPITVPFTMQTFAIFFAISLLGGKGGFLSVLDWLLLGAVGLAVFSGFTGGIGKFANVTGGYLVGFLLSALLVWGITHFLGTKSPSHTDRIHSCGSPRLHIDIGISDIQAFLLRHAERVHNRIHRRGVRFLRNCLHLSLYKRKQILTENRGDNIYRLLMWFVRQHCQLHSTIP